MVICFIFAPVDACCFLLRAKKELQPPKCGRQEKFRLRCGEFTQCGSVALNNPHLCRRSFRLITKRFGGFLSSAWSSRIAYFVVGVSGEVWLLNRFFMDSLLQIRKKKNIDTGLKMNWWYFRGLIKNACEHFADKRIILLKNYGSFLSHSRLFLLNIVRFIGYKKKGQTCT